jgi:hypothetical protein
VFVFSVYRLVSRRCHIIPTMYPHDPQFNQITQVNISQILHAIISLTQTANIFILYPPRIFCSILVKKRREILSREGSKYECF